MKLGVLVQNMYSISEFLSRLDWRMEYVTEQILPLVNIQIRYHATPFLEKRIRLILYPDKAIAQVGFDSGNLGCLIYH